MTITINPDLQSLIPPLTAEEYAQLEANLLAVAVETQESARRPSMGVSISKTTSWSDDEL